MTTKPNFKLTWSITLGEEYQIRKTAYHWVSTNSKWDTANSSSLQNDSFLVMRKIFAINYLRKYTYYVIPMVEVVYVKYVSPPIFRTLLTWILIGKKCWDMIMPGKIQYRYQYNDEICRCKSSKLILLLFHDHCIRIRHKL